MSDNQKEITVKIGDLLDSKQEFDYLSKGLFVKGKTILRMSKIAQQFWKELKNAEDAINTLYEQNGKWNEEIKQFQVDGDGLKLIKPEIRGIRDEEIKIAGSKFCFSDLYTKADKKTEGSFPSILYADLIYKLDWLIEIPDDIEDEDSE